MEPETAAACMAATAASCDDAACMQRRAGDAIHALTTAAPTSVQQMLKRPDKEEWLAASRAEMENMEEHEIYELVAAPPACTCLSWAADGCFYARLMNPGTSQGTRPISSFRVASRTLMRSYALPDGQGLTALRTCGLFSCTPHAKARRFGPSIFQRPT